MKRYIAKTNILRHAAVCLTAVLCVLILLSCSEINLNKDGMLRVHFLDVGQSDAAFVEFGSGLCMLVDTADAEHSVKVCEYIKKLGYDRIDTLLISHPHADHAGGGQKILETFRVGRVLLPDTSYTTPELESMHTVAREQGVMVQKIGAGDGFAFGECEVMFLSGGGEYEDENDQSAAMRLSFGDRSFLFMGDCTGECEEDIMSLDFDLLSDVVKVAHHGSGNASSERFIKATGAKYALVSCSADNEYSHPSPYTVHRWEKQGACVIATDEYSDTVFTTDGQSLNVEAKNGHITAPVIEFESVAEEYLWMLDKDKHTVHRYGCNITDEKDKIQYSNADIEKICAEGYKRCKKCFGE